MPHPPGLPRLSPVRAWRCGRPRSARSIEPASASCGLKAWQPLACWSQGWLIGPSRPLRLWFRFKVPLQRPLRFFFLFIPQIARCCKRTSPTFITTCRHLSSANCDLLQLYYTKPISFSNLVLRDILQRMKVLYLRTHKKAPFRAWGSPFWLISLFKPCSYESWSYVPRNSITKLFAALIRGTLALTGGDLVATAAVDRRTTCCQRSAAVATGSAASAGGAGSGTTTAERVGRARDPVKLRTFGSHWLPIRHLEGAGIPIAFTLRRLEGGSVLTRVLVGRETPPPGSVEGPGSAADGNGLVPERCGLGGLGGGGSAPAFSGTTQHRATEPHHGGNGPT